MISGAKHTSFGSARSLCFQYRNSRKTCPCCSQNFPVGSPLSSCSLITRHNSSLTAGLLRSMLRFYPKLRVAIKNACLSYACECFATDAKLAGNCARSSPENIEHREFFFPPASGGVMPRRRRHHSFIASCLQLRLSTVTTSPVG